MQSASAPPPSNRSPLLTPIRRRSFAGLAGAAAAATLAGCASEDTSKDLNTLRVWGGVPPESGPQTLVDHFMEKHPDQHVTYTRFVNDDRGNLKLNTALQGGVDIDVFFTYDPANLAMRSGSGMASDVSDLVRSTPEFEPFLDTNEPKALFDGEAITALATTKEPNFLLLNESMRDEAGISLPEAWKLDEYLEAVRELAGPERYGTYKLPDLPRIELGPNYWYTEDGGSNFEHPAFLRHFDLTAQMIREGQIFPWSQVLARQIEAYQQNNFIAGDFAVWGTAPFSLRYLNDPENYPHDFLTSCAPMPTIDGAGWNSGVYGNHIQINAKSPKQEIAREFVKFWLLEGAADMAPGGKIPALDNVDPGIQLEGILGEDMESYFDVASFRHTLFDNGPKLLTDTNLTAVAEITHTYEQQRDVCWLLERTPERAITTIHADADALIERFRED
ncbi:ABC transporter substrate-binding protein [Brachybacterium sp. GCM10030252]|uniref:ABC transporter substrate-binding protein n=1 Tax=Brachybacterium sp. GCM10030252 TaxID=3273380 RepID=UPI003608152F